MYQCSVYVRPPIIFPGAGFFFSSLTRQGFFTNDRNKITYLIFSLVSSKAESQSSPTKPIYNYLHYYSNRYALCSRLWDLPKELVKYPGSDKSIAPAHVNSWRLFVCKLIRFLKQKVPKKPRYKGSRINCFVKMLLQRC